MKNFLKHIIVITTLLILAVAIVFFIDATMSFSKTTKETRVTAMIGFSIMSGVYILYNFLMPKED